MTGVLLDGDDGGGGLNPKGLNRGLVGVEAGAPTLTPLVTGTS